MQKIIWSLLFFGIWVYRVTFGNQPRPHAPESGLTQVDLLADVVHPLRHLLLLVLRFVAEVGIQRFENRALNLSVYY